MKRVALSAPWTNRVGSSSSLEDLSPAGFEELAMPMLGPLHNLACWFARDRNDAEDLVQETYLKALRHFSSYQPGTNFRAWMFCILRNTFFTSRSREKAAATVCFDPEDGGSNLAIETETPETLLMKHISLQLLQRAIEDLPVHYRATLLLCDVEEMSYREIASILAIPIGTVMSRLARARKMVRESLDGADGPQPRGLPLRWEKLERDGSALRALLS